MNAMMTKLFTGIAATLLAIGFGNIANAQVAGPYIGDFETANTSPSSKAYAALDSITMNGVTWIMPGVFLGAMTTGDRYNGARCARMRLTNNSTGTPSSIEMVSDLAGGVGTISYKAARYGSDALDSIMVMYSSNGGGTWNPVSTDPVTDTILTTFTHTINVAGNVRVKFMKKSTASTRVSLDDISITNFTGTGPVSPSVVSKSPTGSNVSLSTTALTVTLSDTVTGGTGNVMLYKVGTSVPVATFAGSAATFVGAVATFSPITLENASEYFVTLDSATFLKGTMANDPILNNTFWVFSTIDTVPPPPILTLNESFMGCIGTEMNAFVQYSVEDASKTWRCSSFGRNDSASVYINGGSAAGISIAQNDWLITKAPLDLAAYSNPELSFYQRKRFTGNVLRKLMVSTNYIHGTDPALATWTQINVADLNVEPVGDNVWAQVSGINLNAYKSTPFYMAFTYQCGTDGAYELTYDDILIANATGIKNVNKGNIGIQVLGEATAQQINLNIDAKVSATYDVQLFDLLGRKLASQTVNVVSGANRVNLSNLNLNTGMYIVRVIGDNGFGTVKAVVK